MKTKDTYSVAIPGPIYMLILMLKHSLYLQDQSLNESLKSSANFATRFFTNCIWI